MMRCYELSILSVEHVCVMSYDGATRVLVEMACATAFLLQIDTICSPTHETDWNKCFVCQINEGKSISLTAPCKKRGKFVSLLVIFSISTHQHSDFQRFFSVSLGPFLSGVP